MNFKKIYESTHTKLFENILEGNDHFYGFVREELHDKDHIDIYSDEPLGSNYSCFDYNQEGDDKSEGETCFHWKDCKVLMDDDGVYWKSKSGKNACALIYCIVKAELKPKHIKLWIAPKDSGEEMGVLEFYSTTKLFQK
ncbi:MAG: hypothetical protein LBD41_08005 [Clostridiales Family XIII bacterium]|jgi:hypothetical protein|nr:hypothetical protein [Clostridiales Family XIII bacterium]